MCYAASKPGFDVFLTQHCNETKSKSYKTFFYDITAY